MITVDEAERIVLKNTQNFGTETIRLESATGRVLAEDVRAERDFPPYNRSTMDGIAIKFKDFTAGQRSFTIQTIQAAGDPPVRGLKSGNCIQIMTGAAIPDTADTVIPIEEVSLHGTAATITAPSARKGQFIHTKGSDERAGSILIPKGELLAAAHAPIAASVGKAKLQVARPPRIVAISTGNELVDITKKPSPYQVRRSNNYAVQAVLAPYAVDMLHLPDNPKTMHEQLERCLASYDAIILSGGVSKGAFDHIPQIMAELSVEMLFHGVKQKPGKPFWFGTRRGGPVVFALPGNPVSTFLCLHKYVLPWLRTCLGAAEPAKRYAVLDLDISFEPRLHYFLQAALHTDKNGLLHAVPISNNGSGDFISLGGADAFIVLPPDKTTFKRGEAYQILALRPIL